MEAAKYLPRKERTKNKLPCHAINAFLVYFGKYLHKKMLSKMHKQAEATAAGAILKMKIKQENAKTA